MLESIYEEFTDYSLHYKGEIPVYLFRKYRNYTFIKHGYKENEFCTCRRYNSMTTERDIELIDKYLLKYLSKAEQQEFELRILQDNEFAETVEFMKNLKITTKEAGQKDIKSKIASIIEENRPKQVGSGSQSGQYFSIKNRLVEFHLRPVYAIAASLLVLIISSIIIVLIVKIPKQTDNMAGNKTDTINAVNSKINKILLESKDVQGLTLTPLIVKSPQFGYGGETPTKPQPILIKTIKDKKFTSHYLFSSNTLVLLGEFNPAKIKHLYQAPLFMVLEYSGSFYHLKRIEGEVRPLIVERDSAIILYCSRK